MSPDSERSARVKRLCETHEIVGKARRRTRYPLTDRIDDAAVEQALCALAETEPADTAEEQLLESLHDEAGRLLRDALVTTLTGSYGLERIVAEASERAGIPACASQVAYCLVVLCQKDDPARSRQGGPRVRTYVLDIGEPGFDDQLRRWARDIATNMAASRERYGQIFEDAKQLDIATLRQLIGIDESSTLADFADALADKLATVITEGLPLAEMSLAAAREEQPAGREYVFQSPLGRWVTTIKNRDFADRTRYAREELARARSGKRRGIAGDDDALAAGSAPADEQYAALVALVDQVAGTRALLDDAIADATRTADTVATIDLPSEDDRKRALGFQAELDFVVAGLQRERRLLGQMLAYVVLGLEPSRKRHVVAILSLRAGWLDDEVRDVLAERMREVLDGDLQPVPALVAKAAEAGRNGIPANRAKALARLREDGRYRATTFPQLTALLDELPAAAGADLEAIAAAVPDRMDARSVKATRHQAAEELGAVDTTFARSFRRYAMKDYRLGRGDGLA